MPQVELFTLAGATPDDAFVHAKGAVRLDAHWSASFRRGIDLSAGIDFTARGGAEIGKQLSAAFETGVDARLGLALQAAFPIDLFTEAGLVARFQAQAAVAAFAGVTVTLSFAEFKQLVHDRVPGPTASLVDIFLEEAQFSAGVWARAAFSAEIIGEAVLVGSLLPTARGGPGFSFSFNCGAGLAFGAGLELVTNVGFRDTQVLVNRLSSELTERAVAEMRAALGETPPVTAGIGVLRMLLPLAMRSAYQLGTELVTLAEGEQRARATSTIVESFLRQAQEELLRAVTDLAVKSLADLIGEDNFVAALLAREDKRQQSIDALRQLIDGLTTLAQTEISSIGSWVTALVATADAFYGIVTLGVLPEDIRDDVEHGLGLFWAGGLLVHRVITFAHDPAGGAADLFGGQPVTYGSGGGAAAYIAAKRRKPASQLNLGDLVQFILGVDDLEAQLEQALPEVARAFRWFSDVTGVEPTEVAGQLLVHLAKPTPERAAELLETLTTFTTTLVRDELLPQVIEPLKKANPDDVALALFLDEIVAPLLISLPAAVLPNIAHLGSPDAAVRFREAISAVLFQTLQRLLFTGVNVILERALQDGEQSMRALGQAIVNGQAATAYNAMTAQASQSQLGFVLLPQDAKTLLEFAADTTRLVNNRVRPALLGATGQALDLGLAVPASRELALRTIAGTDDPPEPAALDNVLGRVADAGWEVVAFVVPRGLELIGRRIAETAVALATAIWEGAKAVVQAIADAIAWLGQQLDALRRQLTELLNQIAQLAANVAAWIQKAADHARTLANEVIERIRSWGLQYIEDFINWLPDWLKWLGEGVRAVYNAAFDGVKWVLNGVLGLLSSVGGWVRDALNARLNTASYDEAAVHADVRNHVLASNSADLTFDLSIAAPWPINRISVGEFTLDGAGILGTASDVLLTSPGFVNNVRSAATTSLDRQSKEAQKTLVQQRLDGKVTDESQARRDFARLVPGGTLQVTITAPAAGATVDAPATVSIRVAGANPSFVEPTLGAPRRLTMTLNGVDHPYLPADWVFDGSGITFTAQIAAVPVAPPTPRPVTETDTAATTPLGVNLELNADGTVAFRVSPDSSVSSPWGDAAETFVRGDIDSDAVQVGPDALIVPGATLLGGREAVAQALLDSDGSGDSGGPLTAVANVRVKMQTPATAAPTVVGSRPVTTTEAWGRVVAEATVRQSETSVAAARGAVLPGQPGLNKLLVAVSDGRDQRHSASATFVLRPPSPDRPGYAAVLQQQRAYADATKTRVLDDAALAGRQNFVLVIRALNAGTATWQRDGANAVRLATDSPRDRASALASPGWVSPSRPAKLSEASVAPGSMGTFEVPITVPVAGGTFSEAFTLVAESLDGFAGFSTTFAATFRRHAPPANTAPPAIAGRAVVGHALFATPGAWSGTTPIAFAYQWRRVPAGGGAPADIPGASADRYTLVAADVGAKVDVVVTAKNGAGSANAASPPTPVVQAVPPANTAPPTISGRAVLGQTLSAVTGAWSGTTPLAFGYRWRRTLASGGTPVEIAGATNATYTLVAADVGSMIDVVVTATNQAGTATATTAPTAAVEAPPAAPPVNTAPPTISGPAVVGQTLSATAGTWSGTAPITLAYQWRRTPPTGGASVEIPGASSAAHTLVTADLGSIIDVVVTATNQAGTAKATSGSTAAVAAAAAGGAPVNTAPPRISGRAVVGQTLTAAAGTWSGGASVRFAYQWRRCDANGQACVNIPRAVARTYRVTAADAGFTIQVVVTATNQGGTATAPSTPTAVVPGAATPPASTAPPTVSGRAVVGQSLTAGPGSWSGTAPIRFAYQWRRCDANGQACVNIPRATARGYRLTAADAGSTIQVVITASNRAGTATAASPPTAVVTGAPRA